MARLRYKSLLLNVNLQVRVHPEEFRLSARDIREAPGNLSIVELVGLRNSCERVVVIQLKGPIVSTTNRVMRTATLRKDLNEALDRDDRHRAYLGRCGRQKRSRRTCECGGCMRSNDLLERPSAAVSPATRAHTVPLCSRSTKSHTSRPLQAWVRPSAHLA